MLLVPPPGCLHRTVPALTWQKAARGPGLDSRSTSRTSRAATRHTRSAVLLQVAVQPATCLLVSESFQKVGALSDQRAIGLTIPSLGIGIAAEAHNILLGRGQDRRRL